LGKNTDMVWPPMSGANDTNTDCLWKIHGVNLAYLLA
jgi:hypothetical protein